MGCAGGLESALERRRLQSGSFRAGCQFKGLYRDNAKENGNYHLIMGYILGLI